MPSKNFLIILAAIWLALIAVWNSEGRPDGKEGKELTYLGFQGSRVPGNGGVQSGRKEMYGCWAHGGLTVDDNHMGTTGSCYFLSSRR